MKIIPENEVEKAAKYYCLSEGLDENDIISSKYLPKYKRVYQIFEAGVTFTQSKFEEIAIEFAKYLFSSKITRNPSKEDEMVYTPPEFNLMKADLIKNGKEFFNNFLKERNGKI